MENESEKITTPRQDNELDQEKPVAGRIFSEEEKRLIKIGRKLKRFSEIEEEAKINGILLPAVKKQAEESRRIVTQGLSPEEIERALRLAEEAERGQKK